MDQIGYTIFVAIMAVISNIIWSNSWYIMPSSLEFLSQQNSEFIETTTSPNGTTPKMSYAGASPNKKPLLHSSLHWNQQKKPHREDNHIVYLSEPLWPINCYSGGLKIKCFMEEKLNHHHPIKTKVPSRISELTTTFLSTLDALPPPKQVQDLSWKITSKDYLT